MPPKIQMKIWVVLNYETKSKRNEPNETKRNEILRNAMKYTKMRNETQRNEIYSNAKRNENILKSNKNNIKKSKQNCISIHLYKKIYEKFFMI